ncbi:MAG TPA: response regulator [Candidatus Thermoplasmatota archaeon]|nr:response regulator [Candidatus Thermoplasmatota archaeon]
MVARILIVDDERHICSLIARLLTLRGKPLNLEVVTAGSYAEAVTLLEASRFDLVLTDYRMPGHSGIDLLTLVRSRWPSTLRVLMTGFQEGEDEARALTEAAPAAIIRKPWDNDTLWLTLALLLQRTDRGRTGGAP